MLISYLFFVALFIFFLIILEIITNINIIAIDDMIEALLRHTFSSNHVRVDLSTSVKSLLHALTRTKKITIEIRITKCFNSTSYILPLKIWDITIRFTYLNIFFSTLSKTACFLKISK